ncbi:hypothetical protein [Pseudogemmobacter faecipullorum]|uniref:Uncharacterized protein n=1 Tax=Pseudogemmobacter faecipullorum TaxID=2755041 RepID=A0ABS8CQ19_9RHOB|nr:hypothetical protein [Pseudogemmobacter faecipullorum]MCB5411497.1 hypothetical protein [Pseudogemmobacter faecipullorum]
MIEGSIRLPLPPSVNALWSGMGQGRRKHVKYTGWLEEAGWRINQARAAGAWHNLPADTWYWTDIRLPQSHLGDSDNRLKAIHDLLHGMGATPDDKWLMGGTYMRCRDVEPGECIVSARAITDVRLNQWEQIRFLAERMIAVRGVAS